MAIFKRARKDRPDTAPPPKAVLAAAIPLSGPEALKGAAARQTAEQWQTDAWYYYDVVGEMQTPVSHIANAVSKADLFGAETDPQTGLITGPTDDARAQLAASLCLGGIGRRAQLQYFLAVCWLVPGEAYVIIRGRGLRNGKTQPDEWLVLSNKRVKVKGKAWTYQDPITLEWVTLGSADRMIRVWSPHPEDQSKANTAIRSALPVLREIEKASMNLASVLDSRIATAGMHAIPQEVDLPLTGDNTSAAEEFSDMLLRAASAGIASPGTAAAQVPVILSMPGELIDAFVKGRIIPDTAMDQTVIDLRRDDLSRLAAALPMPKSVAEGSQAESNHWSAWQVEEETYKVWIEPLLDRVGDAFTEFWYRPVLAAMGVQNVERHTLAWDTTGIVARPDVTEDLNYLYENGLVSDDYRRQESGIPGDAIPSEEETQLRRLERVVMGAPTLAADPEIGRRLFGFEVAPAAAGVDPGAADVSAGNELEPAGGSRESQSRESQSREIPSQRAEPDAEDVPNGLVAAAELIVFDALSRAGGRLLTREHRGQFGSTPKHELYRAIPYNGSEEGTVERLMADSFQFVGHLAASAGTDPQGLETAVQEHVTNLLTHKTPHRREALVTMLRHYR